MYKTMKALLINPVLGTVSEIDLEDEDIMGSITEQLGNPEGGIDWHDDIFASGVRVYNDPTDPEFYTPPYKMWATATIDGTINFYGSCVVVQFTPWDLSATQIEALIDWNP